MLKSLDWANAIAEKRARPRTSLDCIFDFGIGVRSVKSCGETGEETGAKERMKGKQ